MVSPTKRKSQGETAPTTPTKKARPSPKRSSYGQSSGGINDGTFEAEQSESSKVLAHIKKALPDLETELVRLQQERDAMVKRYCLQPVVVRRDVRASNIWHQVRCAALFSHLERPAPRNLPLNEDCPQDIRWDEALNIAERKITEGIKTSEQLKQVTMLLDVAQLANADANQELADLLSTHVHNAQILPDGALILAWNKMCSILKPPHDYVNNPVTVARKFAASLPDIKFSFETARHSGLREFFPYPAMQRRLKHLHPKPLPREHIPDFASDPKGRPMKPPTGTPEHKSVRIDGGPSTPTRVPHKRTTSLLDYDDEAEGHEMANLTPVPIQGIPWGGGNGK